MIITGLALGTVLGAVLQRGRFCVTGFLRDIYLRRTMRPFTALLIVISIQAIGVQLLTSLGIIQPEFDPFAPLAVIGGSLLFGIGIVLAGGCASGTWYRAGEGLVGSWIALIAYALSAAAMKTGALTGLNDWGRSIQTEHVSIAADTGINTWVFILGLSLGTAVLAWRYTASAQNQPQPRPQQTATAVGSRFAAPIPLYRAAVLVGVIGVVAWPLSAAAGRNDGLGITTPSKNVVNYLVTGESSFLDWGALLVLGILAGSLVAALSTGEFRVRVPDSRTAVASLIGGVFMGIGASWAGGCTVGNGMVQTSLFSYQGWIALAFTTLGVWLAAKFYLAPSTRGSAPAQDQPTLNDSTDQLPSASLVDANRGTTALATRPAPSFQAIDLGLETTAPSREVRALGEGRYSLDSRGDVCPFPLLKLKNAVATLEPGDVISIVFDCTQATDAIPSWAAENGHSILDFVQLGPAEWEITLRLYAVAS
ncbi:putative inner membrane protein [Corynebacterium ciconiae DSM 44920]|uniref:YeeE/YedE thiosulfate transporter family protein n=1 Tax=Corynebacterium ciconiae TaxID=227319 RepID=UPI000377E413|nr:YeeE/YedE thiosulfate transporter family protein [Corynebacterium ciconiae]WKD61536.1 putative inner membrane protein [Corynebacterium ciconiae DSM 44920]